MIVEDRSCSMNDRPTGGGAQTKWQIATQVLNQLTTDYASKLHFGLIMFPDKTGDNCLQDGPIYVSLGPNAGAAVQMALADPNNQPGMPCVTNIDTAMGQVPMDPAFASPQPMNMDTRRGFVLLITDGMQANCGNVNQRNMVTVQEITRLYNDGYPTYVVGFGGAVDPAALNQFAMAGGVPHAGTPQYYKADTAADLQTAIGAIAGTIGGDEFSCAGTPCPDGRCFGAGLHCMGGRCVGGGAGGAGGSGGTGTGGSGGAGTGGSGGSGAGSAQSGCGCQVGARLGEGARLGLAVGLCLLAYWGRRARFR